MKNFDIGQLSELIRTFCSERDWDQFHNPKDLAVGLAIEAGELLELFRFKDAADVANTIKDKKSRERISDELADCFYFILRFADLYKFDLEKALQTKLAKNAKKYPVALAKGKNLKYSQLRRKPLKN